MKPLFTVGIVTDGKSDSFVIRLIDSIRSCKRTDVEIVLVGGVRAFNSDVHIPFDERARDKWITKKKNIVTKVARGKFVVYCHDYLEFLPGWFEGFDRFGYSFDVCMTPIVNADGVSRFRDWCLWPHAIPPDIVDGYRGMLLPYEVLHLSQFMYFSGAYWIGLRDFMLANPLKETLVWGQGEDVEWSERVRGKTKFSLNPYSKVKLQKYKDPVFHLASEEFVKTLTSLALKF